jgi:long-subunit fatty acid transport protein
MERRIHYLLTIFLCLFLVTGGIGRDVTKVGTTAAPFLTISLGARAMAMGGAFSAVANDASAMYWNVAGIGQLNKTEIIFNHSNWLLDINYDYGGIVMPLSTIGTLGVSFTFLSMGEFEQTTEFQPDGTGINFSANSFAIGLSYGRRLTDNFLIGFTGKYIKESIFNSSAQGFAMDVGALFTTPFNGMRIGLSISNFGTKMKMDGDDMLVQVDIDPTISGNNPNVNANIKTDEFDLPLLFRFGLAMDVMQTEQNIVTVAVDALHPNDNAESVNLGAEYTWNNMLSLRAGYRSLFLPDSEEGFTAGAGLQLEFGGVGLQLDYAYEDFSRLGDIQKFTVFLKL